MRIREIRFYALDIPFVSEFNHAAKSRSSSDTILLKVTMENGTIGWGEALVRPYLTGETVEEVQSALQQIIPQVAQVDWMLSLEKPTPLERLAPLARSLNEIIEKMAKPSSVMAWNGLRCLIELAVVDALLRDSEVGLAKILPPVRREIFYSGVISSETTEKSIKIARWLNQLGIKYFKLKVSPETGIELISKVRSIIGDASLRLDANASFSLLEAKEFCSTVEKFDLSAIEEPLKGASMADIATLQSQTNIPLMVDEMLITLSDATKLAEKKAVRMFNIRLAKCGGLIPCLVLMELAKEQRIGYQLGALVGETAILSAVGRSLAAYDHGLEFVEGSYGTLLLKEDVSKLSVRFGHGGRASILKGKGLGVEIDETIVQKYSTLALFKEWIFSK